MQQHLKITQPKPQNKTRLIRKKLWKPSQTEKLKATNPETKMPSKQTKQAKKTKTNLNYYAMYQSSKSYVLDDMNSIACVNDRIYNLMKFKPRALWGRVLKCNCARSKCQSKYCQCFSNHEICSDSCACQGCNNTDESRYDAVKSKKPEDFEGCRCSKSACLKNYCQCFQRGERCGDKCKCAKCKNSL